MSTKASLAKQLVDKLSKLDNDTLEQLLENISDQKPTKKKRRRGQTTRSGRKIGKDKGKASRIEPIEYGERENEFLTMTDGRGRKIMNSHVKDKKVDKILLGDLEASPRSRPSDIIEAECDVCGEIFSVSSKLVHEGRFVCNDCTGQRS